MPRRSLEATGVTQRRSLAIQKGTDQSRYFCEPHRGLTSNRARSPEAHSGKERARESSWRKDQDAVANKQGGLSRVRSNPFVDDGWGIRDAELERLALQNATNGLLDDF